MKKNILLFLAVSTIVFGACNSATKNEETTTSSSPQNFTLDTMTVKSGDAFYQCVMDPEVLSDKAGSCPKYGMDLDKKIKK